VNLRKEVDTLATWTSLREKQQLGFLKRLSEVNHQFPLPRTIINERDGGVMT